MAAAVDVVVHSAYAINVRASLYGTSFDADHALDTLQLSRDISGERYHWLSKWVMRLPTAHTAFRGVPAWTQEAAATAPAARTIAALHHLTSLLETAV